MTIWALVGLCVEIGIVEAETPLQELVNKVRTRDVVNKRYRRQILDFFDSPTEDMERTTCQLFVRGYYINKETGLKEPYAHGPSGHF